MQMATDKETIESGSRKVLGLDLGVGSIGWALIEEQDGQLRQIVGMGSRIVPIESTDVDKFSKGQAITINAERTARRTARKGLNRYQQRRAALTERLREKGMLPDFQAERQIGLWELRSNAATPGCQLSLQQIGRVLYHLNQKRGYKHSKADEGGDKKQTDYVEKVNSRYATLKEEGLTIGQHMYQQLVASAVMRPSGPYYTFRVKGEVYPRAAYMEEFDRIMDVQKAFYPDVLTDEWIAEVRNRVIFYQRPLKSCKHLVSLCEFESKPFTIPATGKVITIGPKCAPRTSPLAQLCAAWEAVNNIELTNQEMEKYPITVAERQAMVEHLCTHDKLSIKDVLKILGLPAKSEWKGTKQLDKGIKGNNTLLQLRKALEGLEKGKIDDLLAQDLPIKSVDMVDEVTGEVLTRTQIAPSAEDCTLYRLWHSLYSIHDEEELRHTLQKNFDIHDESVLDALCKIDFVKPGYSNKSHKFIRKILPYLMEGMKYSEACEAVEINHSNSQTAAERDSRMLLSEIPLIKKGELRQPLVEKILNQMINVVNALRAEYGEIDEVHVELARELKQSQSERENADKRNSENEKRNKEVADRIKEEHGLTPTRARILKYKLWEESAHKCFYCEKDISGAEVMNGSDGEIEHIIPQSVLFDDSFSNKVLACRACNQAKGNQTAREFMEKKSAEEYEAYLHRVEQLYNGGKKDGKISTTKYKHLLWRTEDIPSNFIDRQLRQSQYISRKAMEILQQSIRLVTATSGSVTDFLRHTWGYDEILHTLNFPRYQAAEMTAVVRTKSGREEERIKDWSKRIDHRHHAIDALTIALTKPYYIQQLNRLNASHDEMIAEVRQKDYHWDAEYSLLEKWLLTQPHFSTQEVLEKVDGILVSFRAGKKVTSPGKRYVYRNGKRVLVQQGLLVPRGALTEETIYGKLGDRYVVKYPLTHPSFKVENIVDPTIKRLVEEHLASCGGNAKNALAKELYSAKGMKIKSVRCYTGLKDSSVAVISRDKEGQPIGYAKLGNNHHIAIYRDKEGKPQELAVTFWQAVERKRYGLPVVVEQPQALWSELIDREDIPQEVLASLPHDDWEFVLSMQKNEMFILGMDDLEFETAMQEHDYRTLNKYLYRVQKVSHHDYYFRYHTETKVDDKYGDKNDRGKSQAMGKLKLIKSLGALIAQHPHKVRINILGEITV